MERLSIFGAGVKAAMGSCSQSSIRLDSGLPAVEAIPRAACGLAASEVLAGGTCDLMPLVPSLPAVGGITVHLQGVLLHLPAPQILELTNALAVTLGP